MGKRLLCWCFLICLIWETVPPVETAYAPDPEFENPCRSVHLDCEGVPESGELHDAVVEIAKLTDWTKGPVFLAEQTVTRDEFYVTAHRKFRGMFADSKTPLEAVPPEKELEQALAFFRKKGYFGPDGSYGSGDKLIERAEALNFLFWVYKKLYRERHNVSFSTTYEVKGFPDIKKTDAFAQAVMWAVSEQKSITPGYYDGKIQIASGFPDGTFRPTGQRGRCTRSEIALYFFRFSSLSFAL